MQQEMLIQTKSNSPVLSSYTDYRKYLSDFYDYKRKQTSHMLRPYSYSDFSAAADIKSPTYLRLIINGQRNLAIKTADKFSKALGHDRSEKVEFEALINYNQAKDPLERNRCLKILSDLRIQKKLNQGQLKSEEMERLPSWVYWALHSMTALENPSTNIDMLYEKLKQRATKKEIQQSLDLLIENNDIVVEGETFTKNTKAISGMNTIPKEVIQKIQAELIYLGMESLINDEPSEREFGAFTIAMTEKEFNEAKFEIRQFRKKLYSKMLEKREESKGEKVYQMNFQLFPLSE